MNLENLSEEERLKLLDEVEENIRISNTPKLIDDNLPICAIIKARMDLNAGLNLEHACPYIRNCKNIDSPEICIGKDNYRNATCYQLKLTDDIVSGKFDKLEVLA